MPLSRFVFPPGGKKSEQKPEDGIFGIYDDPNKVSIEILGAEQRYLRPMHRQASNCSGMD